MSRTLSRIDEELDALAAMRLQTEQRETTAHRALGQPGDGGFSFCGVRRQSLRSFRTTLFHTAQGNAR
jgi:hypothetical protein